MTNNNDASKKSSSTKKVDKAQQKKDLLGMIESIMKGNHKIKMTKDDENEGYRVSKCPYNQCDGGGYISEFINGEEHSRHCQCYLDNVFLRKLKNANIQQDYWKARIENLKELDVSLMQPKTIVAPRKPDKRFKDANNIPPETAEAHLKRVYDERPVKKGIHFFAQQYTEKTLEYLEMEPRTKTRNLILIGESGRQKTYLACAIGAEFLKQNKTVYFSTMQDIIDNVLDKRINLHKIVTETDLLIIDELSNEYHTESEYTLKRMKEIFRLRKNRNLPIICTSNYYPNAWEVLYDKPLISTLNGSFFITLLAHDIDFRVEQMVDSYEDYEFFE